MEFREPEEAFEDAIKQGRLSRDESHPLYAGNFMYMGTENGTDQFKHIMTRQYLRDRQAGAR